MENAHALQVCYILETNLWPYVCEQSARKPITVVVGAPIAVEKNPSPSEELVASIHEKYVSALEQLFNTHKAQFGAADANLNILTAHSSHKKHQ